MEDNTVTIRDRDTMEQIRVSISDLYRIIDEKVNMRTLLV
jgi:glycyl-tRNA synthetase